MKFGINRSPIRPALRISLIYFVVGAGWILISDRISLPSVKNDADMQVFQTVKGLLYVLLTAVFLFLLIHRQVSRQYNLIRLLKKNNKVMRFGLARQNELNIFLLDKNNKVLLGLGRWIIQRKKELRESAGENELEWVEDPESRKKIQAFLKNGAGKKIYQEDLLVDGKFLRFRLISYPSENSKGRLRLLIVEDLTLKKQLIDQVAAERNQVSLLRQRLSNESTMLRIHQARFRMLADNLNEGVVIRQTDPTGKPGIIEYINDAAISFLGLNKEKFSADGLWNRFMPEKPEEKELLTGRRPDISRPTIIEGLLTFPEGHVRVIVRTEYISSGSASFMMYTITRLFTRTVTSSEDDVRVYNMLGAVNAGVVLVDSNYKCFYCNPSLFQMLGNRRPVSLPASISEVLSEPLETDFETLIEEAFSGDIVASPDFRFPARSGHWYSFVLYPVRNENGVVDHVMGITHDNTLRRAYEEMLDRASSLADSSNRLKTGFLSNLSHEVRTPMNGILGFIELLEQEELTETQKYHIDLIRRSGEKLLSILDALIEMAKIENEQVTVEKKWTDMSSLVEEVNDYMKQKITESSKAMVESRCDYVPDHVPTRIYTDGSKLVQVLKLLIDNAVKFTQWGYIEFGIESTNENSGTVNLWIKDTGVGISDAFKYQIFQPFVTFKDSENVLYGGLGVGLSIARGLVELLGGQIEVESEVGKGSRFIVTLPLQMGEDSKENIKIVHEGSEKIMLVQYGFHSVKELSRKLRSHNIKVVHANDGVSAIEKLFEEKDISLVITDIRLSDIDAFELLRSLKKVNPKVPVIAQTSYYLPEEKIRCMNEGFVDYIVKPIDPSAVARILRRPVFSI